MLRGRCPYCAQPVAEEAIACQHCGRDFFLLKPLLDQVDTLTARIAALEAELAQARQGLPAGAAEVAPPLAAPLAPLPVADAPAADAGRAWLAPLAAIAILLAAHALIVLVIDMRLVYLRLVSLLVPFVAGFLFRRSVTSSLWLDGLVGLVVAVCAIAGMLATVSAADGIPLLPQSRQEWIEACQYGSSIAAGFFSGALLRQVVLLARGAPATQGGAIAGLARVLGAEIVGDDEVSLEKRLKRTEQILTTTFATAAAVVSAILGLARLFD